MLGLLVVGCFEFFCSSVKCAEAGERLEFIFHGILIVTLDMDIAISSAQDLSFGRPGAPTSAP